VIFGLFKKSENALAKEQLEAFLKLMKGCEAQDLGLTAALVEHFANAYVAVGKDFYNPAELMRTRPETLGHAISEVQRLQLSGLQVVASGWMIWAHTFRATKFPDLVPAARQMWKYLSGGFPFARAQAGTLEPILGFVLLVEHPERFPIGFEPNGKA
jgi:hypothetical protein